MKVLLGVTGGIAAFKMLNVASKLVKSGYEVEVCMTEEAQKFVTPLSFEALIHRKVVVRDNEFLHNCVNQHIALANECDLMVIAPATANTIAKLANGIADNIVTLTALAMPKNKKKIVLPAMNYVMYEADITQKNISELSNREDYEVYEPNGGYLACGCIGRGRLLEVEQIFEIIQINLEKNKTFKGKKVLINAGATKEAIDPVRFITNHSSGKMGYAIAKEFIKRGAEVTLISGETNLSAPFGLSKFEVAVSANDMYDRTIDCAEDNDIIVLTAAVADYTPKFYSDKKIKKGTDDIEIPLKRTKDILSSITEKFNGKIVVGFAMETDNVHENAMKKLNNKGANLIVANELSNDNAVFGSDFNKVTIIGKNGSVDYSGKKSEVAAKILDVINAGEIYD